MKETVYIFKVDSQYRIALTSMIRLIYDFNNAVYIKLQVIDEQKYIQISGHEIDFYQAISTMDPKGRFVIPKEVRQKFDIQKGDSFESFEDEVDSNERSLLLRKVLKR